MFDPKVYRNACRELNASEEKIKEIIAMTENKDRKNSRRTMRTILVACAAITMMVVGVGAANPEAAQEIFGQIVSRSEEHTSELQSHHDLVCRLLLEKKK